MYSGRVRSIEIVLTQEEEDYYEHEPTLVFEEQQDSDGSPTDYLQPEGDCPELLP